MTFDKSFSLAQVLNKSALLDQSEIEYISHRFKTEILRSGEFFIKEGMPVHTIAFVVSGILRRYKISRQGNNIILQFITEEHFFGDLDGYFQKRPSKVNVQAISNCQLLTITMKELDKLRNENPKFAAIIHFISNEAIKERIRTEELILTGSPYEKFQHFLYYYSHWATRIPLIDIASYLQIRLNTLRYIGSPQL